MTCKEIREKQLDELKNGLDECTYCIDVLSYGNFAVSETLTFKKEESIMEWDVLNAKFREVREALNKPGTISAYLLCWKKPWKFYREHTAQEAIEILIKEAGAHDNV